MSTITTRSGKGSPLTNNEVDANFTNLNTDKLESADLSGYATLSGATFTGEVEATGFNGNLTGAILFKGQAGEGLAKGDPVYISGISGNKTVVSKADANDSNKMPCFGIVDATVSANADCSVVTFGTLQGLDTSSFSEGDELFVSDTGTLTTTAPTGESSQIQKIGKVTRSHASAGSIKVMGAGRTNAVPNLNDGKFFLGNGSNQAVSTDFASSVTAAGALMDSELTDIASVKALNQGVATTDSPTFSNLTLSGTDSVKEPSGTTGQRNGSPANGMFRYNSTTAEFEGYQDGAWGSIGGDIVDGAVTTAKIADDAVTPAKIASGDFNFAKSDQTNGATLSITNSFNGSGWDAGDILGSLNFRTDDTSTTQPIRGQIKVFEDSASGTTYPNSNAMSFSTGLNNDLTERMRIASDGIEISNGAIALKNAGTQSKIDLYCESSNAHYTRIQAAPHSSYTGNVVLTLPASDGDAGQVLQTDGSGVMSWATSGGGAQSVTPTVSLGSNSRDVTITNYSSYINPVFVGTIGGVSSVWTVVSAGVIKPDDASATGSATIKVREAGLLESNASSAVTIQQGTRHRYWRLTNFTGGTSQGSYGNFIRHINFYSNAAGTTKNGNYATRTASYFYSSSYPPSNTATDNANGWWSLGNASGDRAGTGTWLKLDNGSAPTVESVCIRLDCNLSYMATAFDLQFSDDNTNWITYMNISGSDISDSNLVIDL